MTSIDHEKELYKRVSAGKISRGGAVTPHPTEEENEQFFNKMAKDLIDINVELDRIRAEMSLNEKIMQKHLSRNKGLIYISGPITGTLDYMERFVWAEGQLKAKGYDVINPAAISSMFPEGRLTHRQYMKIDKVLLSACDGIFLLKNWKRSKRARKEFRWARRKRLRIISEDIVVRTCND